MQISFYNVQTNSQFERPSRGSYVQKGSYVRKPRWTQCVLQDATHFDWTSMSDASNGAFETRRVEPITDDLRAFFARFGNEKRRISYDEIMKFLLSGDAEIVPTFIKGAILANVLHAHQKHGATSDYCKKFYPSAILEKLTDVEPVYGKSVHFPPAQDGIS